MKMAKEVLFGSLTTAKMSSINRWYIEKSVGCLASTADSRSCMKMQA